MDDPKISPDKPAIDEATANKVVSDHKNPPAGTLALAGFRAAFAALLMVIALSAAFPYMAENLAPGTIFTPIMILIMFITLAHMAWDASSLLRKPAGMSSRAMAKLIAACILPSIPIFMFIRSHDMSFFFFIAAMAFVVMCALIIFGGETINIENFLKRSAVKRPEELPLSPGTPMIMVILRNVTLRVFLAMLLSIGFSFFFFVILKANVELTLSEIPWRLVFLFTYMFYGFYGLLTGIVRLRLKKPEKTYSILVLSVSSFVCFLLIAWLMKQIATRAIIGAYGLKVTISLFLSMYLTWKYAKKFIDRAVKNKL